MGLHRPIGLRKSAPYPILGKAFCVQEVFMQPLVQSKHQSRIFPCLESRGRHSSRSWFKTNLFISFLANICRSCVCCTVQEVIQGPISLYSQTSLSPDFNVTWNMLPHIVSYFDFFSFKRFYFYHFQTALNILRNGTNKWLLLKWQADCCFSDDRTFSPNPFDNYLE